MRTEPMTPEQEAGWDNLMRDLHDVRDPIDSLLYWATVTAVAFAVCVIAVTVGWLLVTILQVTVGNG